MKKYLIAFLIIIFSTQIAFATYGVQTKTSHCIVSVLPDSACSPGRVLTTDIKTICTVGYTKTVRNVTDTLKKKVFKEYDIDWKNRGNYEVDHIISLELGGSNDISNLYPESYLITNGARVKDKFENYLHKQVCDKKLSIEEAQKEISSDWLTNYNLVFSKKVSTTPTVATAKIATIPPTSTTGKYYTSSYSTSKYYYPETCSGWKSLNAKYLKSFNTLGELLKIYPNRTLSSQC